MTRKLNSPTLATTKPASDPILTAGVIRLIRPVATIILGITHVAHRHTAAIGTLELSWLAGLLSAALWVLIAAV